MSPFEAFVMAGGGSRRFGRDKARAVWKGQTLLQRNARVLAQRYDRVRVVSAPGRDYGDLGFETLFDEYPGMGPLAGIHVALKSSETERIAIAACDLVGLRSDWYEDLESACDSGAAAFFTDRWQPLVAMYHRDLLPELESRLADERLAVRALLDEFGTRVDAPPGFEELISADSEEALP